MEDWKLKKAHRRVRKVKGFYTHFTSWAVFSVFFIVMNLWTDPMDFWAIYPIISWGVVVVLHAVGVFGLPWMGHNWEARMIERELERIEHEEQLRESIPRDDDDHGISPATKYLDEPDDSPFALKKLIRRNKDSDFV